MVEEGKGPQVSFQARKNLAGGEWSKQHRDGMTTDELRESRPKRGPKLPASASAWSSWNATNWPVTTKLSTTSLTLLYAAPRPKLHSVLPPCRTMTGGRSLLHDTPHAVLH